MELPSSENQAALLTVLGIIGTALGAIARALFKLLNHFLDKKVEEGKLIANVANLVKEVDEIKKDIDGLALVMKTPRALAKQALCELEDKNASKAHE